MEPRPASHPLSALASLPSAGASLPSALDGPCEASRDAARLGLYVHVPFCAVRCAYCDFSSGALSSESLDRYLEAMALEIARRAPVARGSRFTSVFFGGGTPSALSSRHFARLMAMLRGSFEIANDAEITLEANPESVRPALLDAWAAGGVNRLSMGAQSFDPEELAGLGRIHDAERPGEAFAMARAHGFRRLSLDLMFGFPGNAAGRLERSLDRALALEPEHLSAYCYIPEPGTPLGDRVLGRDAALPPPEAQADQYAMLTAHLERAGFGCYETSNFCRPGAEARHNLVYWLRRDHMALGPSAHGLWNGVRFGNHYALERWAGALEAGAACDVSEVETETSRADEIMMLGLRFGVGLAARDHTPERWAEVMRRYGAPMRRGVELGRLERTDQGVRIGRAHRFVADDTIAWLAAAADPMAPARADRGEPSTPTHAVDLTPAHSAP